LAIMFGQRQRLRRIAARILVVWLFALATGFVNACLVEPASAAALEAGGAHHHALAASPAADHHGMPDANKASCQKFCADEASSVLATKQALDPGPALGLALLPALPLWIGVDDPGAADARADTRPPAERVPIPIALLRLTL
jgi:hypothetical protein